MNEEVFKLCYNRYLRAEKGEAFWMELAIEASFPTKENPDGEKLRLAIKSERIKRGLPTKSQILANVSGSEDPSDYIEKIEQSSNEDDGEGESSIIMHFPEESADKLKEIFEAKNKKSKDMLRFHGFDTEIWEIGWVTSNGWNMPSGGGSKIVCYQSKITITLKGTKGLTLEDVDDYFDKKTIGNHIPSEPKQYSEVGEVLEIDLADFHINNKGVYDSEFTIREKLDYVSKEIYNKCIGRKFSKIVFAILGDTCNVDTKSRTTTQGTGVTTNGMTNAEMFDDAFTMFVELINFFSNIAPIEVVPVNGNHDYITSYMLVKALEAWFRNDENIEIDSAHLPRKTRTFGNTLVGFVHGNMSIKNMRGWLQVEAREDWGETKWSEIHAGHVHHQKGEEGGGIIIRYLPSIADTDEWHYEKGFIGARKGIMSFVWDLEDGLKEMWFSSVDNMK